MSAGSFAGSISAGWLSDYLGRRGSLMIASLVWIVGAMVQCSAQNVTHLVAGRVVSGLAVGDSIDRDLVAGYVDGNNGPSATPPAPGLIEP